MFKLEFTTDNAAFENEAAEIARILRHIADYIEHGGINAHHGRANDLNGNRVGEWSWT
jgi:hypothetical protein